MAKKLFVGGLPWAIDDQGLANEFAKFGQVKEAKVINDRETGRSRGFGFVTFDNDAEADEAIKVMDQSLLGGRTINVNEAKERESRPSGGGGGGPRHHGGGGGGGYSGGGGDRGGKGGGRRDRGDRRRDDY